MEISEMLPGFETSAYHHKDDNRCSGKEPKARATLFLYVNFEYLERGRKRLGDILAGVGWTISVDTGIRKPSA